MLSKSDTQQGFFTSPVEIIQTGVCAQVSSVGSWVFQYSVGFLNECLCTVAIPLIPTLLQFIFIFKVPKNLLLNHFDESTMCFCRLRSCILWQKFTEMTLSLSVYSVNDLLWVKCSCHTLLAHSEQDKRHLVASVKAVLDLPLTLLVFLLFTCLSDTRN